jgi:hypothetical protein
MYQVLVSDSDLYNMSEPCFNTGANQVYQSRSKRKGTGITDGVCLPLLCSPHFNPDLQHITLGI